MPYWKYRNELIEIFHDNYTVFLEKYQLYSLIKDKTEIIML